MLSIVVKVPSTGEQKSIPANRTSLITIIFSCFSCSVSGKHCPYWWQHNLKQLLCWGSLISFSLWISKCHSCWACEGWFSQQQLWGWLDGFTDAHNGLLLYKPVEWAFNRAKLFVEIIDGMMTFHLIDQELENIKLVDKAIELWTQNGRPGACSWEEAVLKITFGNLDGAVLSFPPNCTMQPSKRMLLMHAYSSWIHVNGTTGRHSPPIYDKSGHDLSGDKDIKNALDTAVMMWRQALDNQQTLDNEWVNLWCEFTVGSL